jgi:hypothetical protein
VIAERVCPVSRFATLTVAPGTAAPEASVAMPAMVPVGAWARAETIAAKTSSNADRHRRVMAPLTSSAAPSS